MDVWFWDRDESMGLGQMKELYEGLLAQGETELKRLASEVGKAAAAPVAEETKSQFKDWLPWMIVGVVALSAMGGLAGAAPTRRRR